MNPQPIDPDDLDEAALRDPANWDATSDEWCEPNPEAIVTLPIQFHGEVAAVAEAARRAGKTPHAYIHDVAVAHARAMLAAAASSAVEG